MPRSITRPTVYERPKSNRKYNDVKTLQLKIDSYFALIKESREVPTVTGLALHLGFADRRSLFEYGQTAKYGPTVKKARAIIENAIEQRLLTGKPPIGLIFWLKNNAGWNDKQDLDITSNGETLGIVQLPVRTSK